jgi:hypothetical protein
MPVTAEDLEHLPYLDRNLGRVFTKDCKENIKLFIRDFRAGNVGSQIKEAALDTGENLDAILEEAQTQTGHEDVNLKEYEASARRMFLIGDLKPKKAATPVVDDAERDRLGRPLSPKAKQWKVWENWCNNPETTMREIHELRRTNAAFAEFFSNQSVRERHDNPVGDAVEFVGTQAIRQDSKIRVTQELREFAQAYRLTPTSEIKKSMSAVMNPAGFADYRAKLDAAIACGLL